MRIWNRGLNVAMATVAVLAAGCAVDAGQGGQEAQEETGQSSAALTSSTISNDPVDGIVYSTGNVYFTTHYTSIRFLDEKGPAPAIRFPTVTTASVMRTGKYSVPGQEITLWSEQGSRFGDIVWALVGGNYFGYFLSQNLTTAEVTIKRVPLAGGTAVDIAGGIGTNVDIVNGHHLLDTDGVSLYWQDDVHVYRMPIGGGAQTVIATVNPNTPTAGVYVTGGNVYFAGPETVESVPTGGGAATVLFTAPTRIVDIAAVPYFSNTMVAWGLQDGSAEFLLSGSLLGIKGADGVLPTSLAPSGGEGFDYTACNGNGCELNGAGNTIANNAFGLGIDNSQPNTSLAFWGDSAGVHRYAIPIIF